MPALFYIFLSILILSPLAFGTVEPWSLAAMEIAAISSVWVYIFLVGKKDGRSLYETPGIMPLFCFICYALVQVIPLPAELTRLISPDSYSIYEGSFGITGRLTWIPISVHPKETLSEFLRFASYAAFYILTVQLLAKGKYLKRAVLVIVFFGAALALFSMFQAFMSNGKIYWFREVVTGNIFGPFTNRNHFAGLMTMIAPVALGLFIAMKPIVVYESLRDRLFEMLNGKRLNNHILVGIAAVIIAASVFLTLSRGGIISLCAAIAFFYLLVLLRKGGTKLSVLILLVSFIVVLIVGWFGWTPIFGRFQQLTSMNLADAGSLDRIEIWKNSIDIIKDFPLTGSGFGSFSSVYPKYGTAWADMQIVHAHNDYIELLAEGGIIALVFVVWFMCAVLYRVLKIIPGRKDGYSICLYTGSLAGIFSMLVFSLSDFNLHIGSNGLYFFFLMGLLVSASHTRLHRGLEPTYLRKYDFPQSRSFLRVVSALLFACLIFNIGVLAGQYCFSPVKKARSVNLAGVEELERLRDNAQKAALFDPLEARYYYSAGIFESRLSNNGNAVKLLDQAVALDPMNSEYMQRLGQALYRDGQAEAGDRLLRAGTIYDVTNPERYKFYAIHLFHTGKKTDAIEYISKAISISPEQAEDLIILMMLRGLSDQEIRSALPERAAAHIAYAAYLANAGKLTDADKAYSEALYYAGLEKKPNRADFINIFRYYVKRELFDYALSAAKQGISALPNDNELHYDAGLIYEKLNMNNAAMQEYKQAVTLDVTNTEAYRRLDELGRKSVGP
jgi:O-antigen ligase/tetratricopeptide (TPR) repeat protein